MKRRDHTEVRDVDLRDLYQGRVNEISDQYRHEVRLGKRCHRKWTYSRIRAAARREAEIEVQQMLNRAAKERVRYRDV